MSEWYEIKARVRFLEDDIEFADELGFFDLLLEEAFEVEWADVKTVT